MGAVDTPGAIPKREQPKHSKHWVKPKAAFCFCSWSEGAPREPNIPQHSLLSARLLLRSRIPEGVGVGGQISEQGHQLHSLGCPALLQG